MFRLLLMSELWHCLILLGVLEVFWFYATLIIFVDNNNNNKMSDLAMLKNSSKTVIDPDPEADEFQNLIVFSWSYCGYLCAKFGEDCFWIVTGRVTTDVPDKQTNAADEPATNDNWNTGIISLADVIYGSFKTVNELHKARWHEKTEPIGLTCE